MIPLDRPWWNSLVSLLVVITLFVYLTRKTILRHSSCALEGKHHKGGLHVSDLDSVLLSSVSFVFLLGCFIDKA